MQDTDIGYKMFLEDTDHNPEFTPLKWKWQHDLNAIERFEHVPMIHHGTVLYHISRVEKRVVMSASFLATTLGYDVDFLKATRIADHHDDPEVVTTDIPTPVKLAMNPDEKQALKTAEDQAAETLSTQYTPQRYRDLYLADYKEFAEKVTTEAQLVDIIDKWDGLGQVLHDIRCGNESPEVYEVLHNYRQILEGLKVYPLYADLAKSPSLGLDHIPTDDDALAMSKIDIRLLTEQHDRDAFWKRVLDPNLPTLYKEWLATALLTNYQMAAFPAWKEELQGMKPSLKEVSRIMYGRFVEIAA